VIKDMIWTMFIDFVGTSSDDAVRSHWCCDVSSNGK